MIDAPYVVVQQVPVWRMIGPYFWVRYERWDCILGFSWPDNRVQSLFHLCAVFLCSTYLYKTSQNCPTTHYSKQHCPVSPEECATFPLLLKSHHIWRKLCMHDCWNVFRVSAWSYGIPSVNILVLIKVFSHKKKQSISALNVSACSTSSLHGSDGHLLSLQAWIGIPSSDMTCIEGHHT